MSMSTFACSLRRRSTRISSLMTETQCHFGWLTSSLQNHVLYDLAVAVGTLLLLVARLRFLRTELLTLPAELLLGARTLWKARCAVANQPGLESPNGVMSVTPTTPASVTPSIYSSITDFWFGRKHSRPACKLPRRL